MTTSKHKCSRCGDEAQVGLGGDEKIWLCMEHFEDEIAKIGKVIKSIPNQMGMTDG